MARPTPPTPQLQHLRPQKVTFVLSWAPDTNPSACTWPRTKGYFKDAGLDVNIVAVAQAGAEQAVNNSVADFRPVQPLTNVGVYTLKRGRSTLSRCCRCSGSRAIWCALRPTPPSSPWRFDARPRHLRLQRVRCRGAPHDPKPMAAKGEFDKAPLLAPPPFPRP